MELCGRRDMYAHGLKNALHTRTNGKTSYQVQRTGMLTRVIVFRLLPLRLAEASRYQHDNQFFFATSRDHCFVCAPRHRRITTVPYCRPTLKLAFLGVGRACIYTLLKPWIDPIHRVSSSLTGRRQNFTESVKF